MTFENAKKQALEKLETRDQSKKGCVDAAIIELVEEINKQENYFTTSSCAGRIALTQLAHSGRKSETEWFFVSHNTIQDEDILNKSELPEEELWFKMESSIIHICCKTIEDAEKLINLAKDAGYKRAHLISIKRNIVEIMDSLKIEVLYSKNKEALLSQDYIRTIIDYANKKLEKTREKIKKLFILIQQLNQQ